MVLLYEDIVVIILIKEPLLRILILIKTIEHTKFRHIIYLIQLIQIELTYLNYVHILREKRSKLLRFLL